MPFSSMFRSDNARASSGDDHHLTNSTKSDNPSGARVSGKDSYALPSGTGPGTTGKPAPPGERVRDTNTTSSVHPTARTDMANRGASQGVGLNDRIDLSTEGVHGHDLRAQRDFGHVHERDDAHGHVHHDHIHPTSVDNAHPHTHDHVHHDHMHAVPADSSRGPAVAGSGGARSVGNTCGMFNAMPTGESHGQALSGAQSAGLAHTGGMFNTMPAGEVSENKFHLHPVTHEATHHKEVEEVTRQRENERHVPHVQVSYQPVNHALQLPEHVEERVHPVTHVRHHQDETVDHPVDRTVVDRGIFENETVQHHVTEVVQPIINKQVTERRRIQTTIPSHHEIHEAPIVHQARTLKPVTLEEFTSKLGPLDNGISPEQAVERFLPTGGCSREVDGIADQLTQDLQLNNSNSKGPNAAIGTRNGATSDFDRSAANTAKDRRISVPHSGNDYHHTSKTSTGTGGVHPMNADDRVAGRMGMGGKDLSASGLGVKAHDADLAKGSKAGVESHKGVLSGAKGFLLSDISASSAPGKEASDSTHTKQTNSTLDNTSEPATRSLDASRTSDVPAAGDSNVAKSGDAANNTNFPDNSAPSQYGPATAIDRNAGATSELKPGTGVGTTGRASQTMGDKDASTVSLNGSTAHSSLLDSRFELEQDPNTGTGQRDATLSGNVDQEQHLLRPVVHEHVRHFEVEEVTREVNLEKHVYHIHPYHVPVVVPDEGHEELFRRVLPPSNTVDRHSGNVQTQAFLESILGQVKDQMTCEHLRRVENKDTITHEHVHNYTINVFNLQPKMQGRILSHYALPRAYDRCTQMRHYPEVRLAAVELLTPASSVDIIMWNKMDAAAFVASIAKALGLNLILRCQVPGHLPLKGPPTLPLE
ncbi:hypothetical protein ONZ45_g14959 [Pleurotus djamor]|nr:hypothetical protein ONZ45_g14959 [Pleurotus djamor]